MNDLTDYNPRGGKLNQRPKSFSQRRGESGSGGGGGASSFKGRKRNKDKNKKPNRPGKTSRDKMRASKSS